MHAASIAGLVILVAAGISGCRTSGNEVKMAEAPTTQADDLGRFNVKRFGARGDGQTDDTRAFQAALDAAAGVQGTVFVPAGVYRIGQIKWHDHTSMVGDPGWSYYIPGGSVLELNDANAPCMIDFTYCQGARL